ncbi:MAG: Crp/Fnr family transcriptional regulator [Clostridia bacterium]|nr:Crp/Fnr family transcriptional regulator [Clostridia bacterium]
MKKYFTILRKCPLFDSINDNDLTALLSCLGARVNAFDKKYTIFSEGSPARYVGILLSGSAQIIKTDYYGNRSIVSAISPSELIGEAYSCAGAESIPVSIVANEPSEIMIIECERILHSCSNSCSFHQQMIFNLMRNLAVKNIMLHKKIDVTSKRSTREKLMTYLMIEAEKQGSSRFSIPFDRQELADYLEVDRSGLSAEISKLREMGVIKSNKKQFELL